MIQVTHLSFSYTQKSFIQDMNFSVDEGEIFGFLGPSGAGKSTLQKILLGMLPYYQGSARVNGRSCKHCGADFYESIGVDFEFSTMYEKLSAKENLQFFSSLYRRQTRSIPELLARVGLENDGDKRVSDYSKMCFENVDGCGRCSFMKAIGLSFFHMLKLIRQDRMLLAAGLTPFLAGIAIRFAVPLAEGNLVRLTGAEAVLVPYYTLFDLFFASLTPVMFCFIAAMVMLEERDDHIDRYLSATALGRNGYYISRIVLPALAAFAVTVILLPVFHLSSLSAGAILFLSLAGTMQGMIIGLLIVTISSNKLEGMAVTKLSSLMMLGAVIPYFVPAPFSFCFSFLPSFWMGKAMMEGNLPYLLPSIAAAGLWSTFLWERSCRTVCRNGFFHLKNKHIPLKKPPIAKG